MEQPKKKSLGLPIAALIVAIVGYALEFAAYVLMLFVWMEIQRFEHGMTEHRMQIILTVTIIGVALCSIGLVLGIVGLIGSLRRPRRVGGIVMSAIAVLFGVSSYLVLIGMQISRFTMSNVP